MTKNIYLKGLYNFANKAKAKLRKLDKSIKKQEFDFQTMLARCSKVTDLVSCQGKGINISYSPWHELFLASTDRDNDEYLEELCCCTGAMCFSAWNNCKEDYDYIVALNSDVYDYICSPIFALTLSHELGHAVMDHQLEDHSVRTIEREVEADNKGFELITTWLEMNKSDFESGMISFDAFNFKHLLAAAAMAYGAKGVDVIQKVYGYKDHFKVSKEISSSIIKINDHKLAGEDETRAKNYEAWLKN